MESDEKKDDCIEIEIPYNLFKYLNTDDYDINSLCRICLSESNKELFPLISTTDSGVLQEMFTACTAIQVVPNDGLPNQICDICRINIMSYYDFKSQCIKSDCALRSLLKGDFLTKKETSEPIETDETNVPVNIIPSEEIKKENEVSEDTHYLYYVDDISASDSETLSIVQKEIEIKKNESKCTELDPKGLLNIMAVKTKERKQKSHVCSYCPKRFRNTKGVKSHIKRMHSGSHPSHSCLQCKESFQTDHDLSLHLPVHAAGPIWTCVQCHKAFKGRSMFRRHIQRHMECKRYSCESCGKPFTELYALRRHSRVHTGEKVEKRHACHLCDKRYAQSSLLDAHMARHEDARPCVCASCGKAFPTARLLESHHRVHLDDKPHACRYCEKRFRHESTARTHERTHTGERPYVCAACGKRFIQNSNLTLHMRTHTGDRPYSCNTCGRSFSSGSTLKTHIRTHTGEKPYECPDCGKRFARVDMRAHRRLHSGERPHACGLCARRFPTAARLRDHHRVHTGEKPFECSQCSTKFGSKSHLVKHVKTHQVKKIQTRNDKINEKKIEIEHNDKKDILENEVNINNAKEVIVEAAHSHDDSNVTGEIIIPSEITESDMQTGALCLTSGMNTDMNLVTYDDSRIRIGSELETTTVKLYQLDQSLLQIHSSGGQLTISKWTAIG